MPTHVCRPVRCALLVLIAASAAACGARAAPPAPAPAHSPAVITAPPPDNSIPLIRHANPPQPGTGDSAPLATTFGEATYYADLFHGRTTASGITFRNDELFAAHRTYPFGTLVRVTNLTNRKDILLIVVDRGPFGTSARAQRTIIDVSRRAAEILDFVADGRVPVRVDVLRWGS